MEDFEMIPVNSSNVLNIGYNENTQTLIVNFINGNIYEYYNVPSVVFEEFKYAPSPGIFLNTNIKNQYPYRKIG